MQQPANPWRDLPTRPPYVSPLDSHILQASDIERGLKLDHPPVPFIGDPRRASVVILNLNPGWSEETDKTETAEYHAENVKSLTFHARSTFFCLGPIFAEAPGYAWWQRRLQHFIDFSGIAQVRRAVACIEWFPYHSRTFHRPTQILPSQRYGFHLAQEAVERGALIVQLRARRLWEEAVPALATTETIALRSNRSGYLSPGNLKPEDFERIRSAIARQR